VERCNPMEYISFHMCSFAIFSYLIGLDVHLLQKRIIIKIIAERGEESDRERENVCYFINLFHISVTHL
jgi:hypothetical protein